MCPKLFIRINKYSLSYCKLYGWDWYVLTRIILQQWWLPSLYDVFHPNNNIEEQFKSIFEYTNAIHNSRDNSLSKELEELMSNLIVFAKTNDIDRVVGKRVSMMPSNTKRWKTHGTKHYK